MWTVRREQPGERRGDAGAPPTEAQAAAQPHQLQPGADRRAGEGVRAHPLPGRVCARAPRPEDHAAGGAHPSVVLQPAGQVAPRGEAEEPAAQQQQ